MELSVLVQPTDGKGFRAWCDQPVSASAEGATREEALEKLRTELLAKTRGAEVARLTLPIEEFEPSGTAGDEQMDTPEAIAAWVAAFDAIPPLAMSAAEESQWKAARRERKMLDAVSIDKLSLTFPGSAE